MPEVLSIEPTSRCLPPAFGSALSVPNVDSALVRLRTHRPPLVLLAPLDIEDPTPIQFLEEVHQITPRLPVLFVASDSQPSSALILTSQELVRRGAHGVITAEMDGPTVARTIDLARNLSRPLLRPPAIETWRQHLVGSSRPMQQVADTIRLVGPRRATVLITGESGTGKEMAARALHLASTRAHLPMVAINCNAIPETLLEAELFGHTKGAFTGAQNARAGRFEQAHQSTLFLDEIGDLPLDLQTKLLRALQEREIQRLGSSETTKVDVRVIAATNANLPEKIRQGRFREDLYYRLNVVPLHMPPLRVRPDDLPQLIHHFLDKICDLEGLSTKQVSAETLDHLRRHDWPGNVRELENSVEKAVALSGERRLLFPTDFEFVRPRPAPRLDADMPRLTLPDSGLDFMQTVGTLELHLLEQALRKANGNKTQAADLLRLKRTTLTAKLKVLEASVGRASM